MSLCGPSQQQPADFSGSTRKKMKQKAYKWREEHVPLFLTYYEKYPCLWDFKVSGYKEREVRDKATKDLLQNLNIPGVTENDIKLKIKSLRTRYSAELKKITTSAKEGKMYEPKLFWFPQADSFLRSVCMPREPENSNTMASDNTAYLILSALTSGINSKFKKMKRTNSSSSGGVSQEMCIVEDTFVDRKQMTKSLTSEDLNEEETNGTLNPKPESSNCSSQNAKRFKSKHSKIPMAEEILSKIDDRLKTLHQDQDDESDVIGKSVAAKLRSLLPIQKVYAKKIINDTLYEAQLNNLSRFSRLNNPSHV